MHLPLRPFLCAGVLIGFTACQTHDRMIYETNPPKNLRVPQLMEVPIVPLGAGTATTPTENPAAATPSTDSPSVTTPAH